MTWKALLMPFYDLYFFCCWDYYITLNDTQIPYSRRHPHTLHPPFYQDILIFLSLSFVCNEWYFLNKKKLFLGKFDSLSFITAIFTRVVTGAFMTDSNNYICSRYFISYFFFYLAHPPYIVVFVENVIFTENHWNILLWFVEILFEA